MKATQRMQDAYNAYKTAGIALDCIEKVWDDDDLTDEQIESTEKDGNQSKRLYAVLGNQI